MANLQLLLDAARLLSQEDSAESNGPPRVQDLGLSFESTISARSGVSRSSTISGRSYADVSRLSRLSRNGIFRAASPKRPPDVTSELDFPSLSEARSTNKIRPVPRTPRKRLVGFNRPVRLPHHPMVKQSGTNKAMSANLTAPAEIQAMECEQVESSNLRASASAANFHTVDDFRLPLTGSLRSHKIRPEPRTPRKPLVDLNGPRRHTHRSEVEKGSTNKAMSALLTSPGGTQAMKSEQIDSSDCRALPDSAHQRLDMELDTARYETKRRDQNEDVGNLTVLDITFGDFSAPITSTPKASILQRNSIDSNAEIMENVSTVSAYEEQPSMLDRWSFAGWVGHAPRADIRSLSLCNLPVKGVLDQTRSEGELVYHPGSEVLRSKESSPRRTSPRTSGQQVKKSDCQTTASPPREMPTEPQEQLVDYQASALPSQELAAGRQDQKPDCQALPTGLVSAQDVLRPTQSSSRTKLMKSSEHKSSASAHLRSKQGERLAKKAVDPITNKKSSFTKRSNNQQEKLLPKHAEVDVKNTSTIPHARFLPDPALPVIPDGSDEPLDHGFHDSQSGGQLPTIEASHSFLLNPPVPASIEKMAESSGYDPYLDDGAPSDASSEGDYSADSCDDWKPSEDESDHHDSSDDMSFQNNFSIREYFEPFKNYMPEEGSATQKSPSNGSQKYSRKAVRSARERGEGYVRKNGTTVPERKVKTPCSCPRSCGEKFTDEARVEMLQNLLQMKSTSQHQFLACHISVIRSKRSQVLNSRRTYTRQYFLPGVKGRIQVCKNMYKSTFDIGDATIRTIAKKLSAGSGMATDDGRLNNKSNKTLDPDHLEFIQKHITSFPASESHYNVAKSEKMYLSSDLNLAVMYRLYKIECKDKFEPVCYDTYRLVFKPMNISFRQPRVDTCGECDKLVLQAKLCDEEEKQKILEQHAKHRERGDLIFAQKRVDFALARTGTDVCCACFDLQKQLPTPSLTCGKSFYARQLYTYNLTVYQTIEGTNSSDCYLWNETQAKRGSQEIGSCVLQHLQSLPTTIKKVIYYSDRCGGQNRNKNIVFMFMLFIERCKGDNRSFEIEHKFMQTGHSHMEVDGVHGAIEKSRKRNSTNIETPHQWAVFISCIFRTNPIRVHELEQSEILDLKSLTNRYIIPKKNLLGDPLRFGDIMVFRYSTNSPGLVYYKYHVTDPFERCFKLLPTEEVVRGVSHVVLKPVYFEPLPIADVKLQDLQKLMPFIKQKDFYSTFLKKLVPVKRGRRAACHVPDDFDADLSESEQEDDVI